MFSRFFIDRPIFASVLSIVITLAGGIAAFQLPLAQYPPVTPPTVQFDCNYPGASAQVVAQTVAAPIEQQVNGVENMLYMSSQCTSDGSYTLTVTFETGVDLNLAQVLVQNRLALAMPQLPAVVRQAGVSTRKRSPELLMTVSMSSPSIDGNPPRYDQLYLSNYALTKLRDEISRLPGISEIILFGQRDYSMRVWLDPDKLAVRGLAVSDVIAALREQNLAVAPGQMGQPPSVSGQPLQVPLSVLGRLSETDEFAEIIIRSTRDGRKIRIRDIGYVELSAKSHDVSNRFDGKPTVGLAVFMLADANALSTADAVNKKMKELSVDFPEGMIYEIGYDTTPFIRESIWEVFKALFDAIALVALVVLIFLQGWRAAIIPLIAVPVAIVGTFGVMALAGFSINNLTLFGLVLAIGIVVDDAIVVVESVEHHIEQGMPPRAAAFKAMDEVSGPVIAVGLVLSAVFIPCAFLSGLVGQFFRQFALTIAVSTVISTFNSLTLSPALAALLLKPRNAKRDLVTRCLDLLLGRLFRAFNFGFRRSTQVYTRFVGALLRVPAIVLVIYAGLVALTWWGYGQLPTGFVPIQDKGYLVASIQLPDSSSAIRTRDVMSKIEKIAKETKGVKNVNAVAGNSFMLSAYGSNFGSMFIILDPFEDRRSGDLYADEIIAKLKKSYASEVPEAIINVFPPPAVSGLGRSGGFKLMVQDRGEVGLNELQQHTDNMVDQGNAQKDRVSGLFTVFNANSPQLFADVDREKCLKEGVSLGDVFSTLQAYLGSLYVNDFNKFGRTWQVVVQADQTYRSDVNDVKRLRVRNSKGQMVPLGTLVDVKLVGGPLVLTRYNMYPAAGIQGNAVSGVSTGQAIKTMEEIAHREFPRSMGFEWTEIAFLETRAADTSVLVFGLAVAGVFLVLAALYESWSLPLAVILVVPMCVLSSLAGVWMAKMDINIFTQIGFVVLIGLASKNAILIVEFAKARREEGKDCREATLHACELRLRPIMMTSFAFIFGVVPLVRAHGAGAEMRRTLGTAVFSGMLGVTLFGILLTPVFFFVIDRLAVRRLFSNRILAALSDAVLDVLSLGFIRRPIRRRLNRLPRQPLNSTRSRLEQSQVNAAHNGSDHRHNGSHANGEPMPHEPPLADPVAQRQGPPIFPSG
jgi:multidrug efflux pump